MKRQILIVDDEPQNLQVLGNMLSKSGYNIILADHGAQALELLQKKKPHIILLDIMMPGIDGFEICKRIKQDAILKDIPIIFLTACTDTEKMLKGFQLGAVDYVTKPFKSAEIISRVKTHIKLKATEDTLRLNVEKLEAANRAKSEFLANMSHEIRTPMNGIIGLTRLALKTELTTQQQDYLTKVDSLTQDLLGIINDILDFSKIEAGKLNMECINFSLDEVLEKLFNTVYLKIEEKGLELHKIINSDIPCYLVGDPLRLLQILINLTTNALKFTEKGHILITIKLIKLESNFVKLHFSIKDTGIGIASKTIPHLFDAFTQANSSTSRKYGGTGLGLAICKCLVKMMDGDIWIKSQLGKGSTFHFTSVFSLQAKKEYVKKQDTFQIINDFQGARILLVEDNLINQQVAKETIESENLVVEIANNGKEAITAIAHSEFDVVLMDVQMPIMDGYEATRLIRKHKSQLPIIAMTAHAMSGDKEKCLASGMNDYITKPINLDILFTVLEKWIKPKARSSPRHKKNDETVELPKELPGFDIDSALKRINGNKKLFKSLLHDFGQGYQNAAIKLRTALDKKDLETALILSHTLKGIAGNLSATHLQDAVQDLEFALKQGGWNDILMDNVESSLTQVLESIKTITQTKTKIEKIENNPTPLNISIITPLILELSKLIEKHSTNTEATLAALKTAIKGTAFVNELKQLFNCLDNFEFDNAKNHMKVIALACDIKL